ncbi:MAG: o-succinylbenzoate--CoA ligase [Burkholderiales bacterium]|jgi:O-succinylbenzoic acid--CoA ligase|nr:o-succinylbenzoate--CoA ligase [Burkholderiales bacterium]
MDWLNKHCQENPDGKWLNELTFQEVHQRVTDLAKRLYSYTKDEKRVAICSHSSVEMALFLLSLQALGKEVLTLNPRLTLKEIEKQNKALGIRVVFFQEGSFTSFDEVLCSPKADIDLPCSCHKDQIAVIMNTSATTGTFKSVPIRWRQLACHVAASRKKLGGAPEDHWLAVLPMYHIGGFAVLMRSLFNGTRVTILDGFDEERTIALINNGDINMLSLVPTMLNRIVDRISNHRLRVVLLGGEFIPKPLIEKCIHKKIPVYKTYGMTETTSQVTTFSVLEHLDKCDSVGSPLDGFQIRISEPDAHGVGNVLIKGGALMDGYLGEAPVADFFDTDDIGYLDEHGFLYLLDRRKNIIISGGENIYPSEIETVLLNLPGVTECAVVGQPDETWGQVPALYLVSSLDEQIIRRHLTENLAGYKQPKKIIYLDKLPRNVMGKLLKKNL